MVNDGSVLDQVQNQSKPTHEQPYITLSFLHSQITVVTRDSVAIIIVSLGGGGQDLPKKMFRENGLGKFSFSF